MNCQNCGNYNKGDNKFCINCGVEIVLIEDYYNILGISRNSSMDDIKKAYHILAHQYHPDKNNGNEKRFKKINEAYRILSGAGTKKEYDEELRKRDNNKSTGFKNTNQENKQNKTEIEKNKYINTYIAVIVVIVGIIIVSVSTNSSDKPMVEDDQTVSDVTSKIDEGTYLIIGGDPIVNDDFSLRFSWFTYGEVLEAGKEVSVKNEYLYDEPHTNGMFAIAVISIKNTGKERKLISLDDFSLVDAENRIYKPYYNYALFEQVQSSFDEKGKAVPIVSVFDDILISIQPGIEEKRAIIFEIAKDIKSASLKFKYNN